MRSSVAFYIEICCAPLVELAPESVSNDSRLRAKDLKELVKKKKTEDRQKKNVARIYGGINESLKYTLQDTSEGTKIGKKLGRKRKRFLYI